MSGALEAPFFRFGLRVYWEDTDAGGVVFYANYLKFFERARTEWLRRAGVGQEALRRDDNTLFVVTEASLRCHKPARLDDWLDVSVEPTDLRQASLIVAQRCWRADTLVAESRIRIGCVNSGTFRPRRIPKSVLDRLA